VPPEEKTLTEEQKTFKRAMGEEGKEVEAGGKEPEIDVSQDGSVKVEDKKVSTEHELTREELIEQNTELSNFASSVLNYTKEKDDGSRDWDIHKIADELGYTVTKKGEQPKEEPKPQTQSKEVSSKTQELLKDPSVVKEIEDLIQRKISEAVAPLEKESKTQRATRMLNEVKNKYEDFDHYSEEIGKLARRFKPADAKDLEMLYFAAKGSKGSSGSKPREGLTSTTTPSRGGKEAPASSDADEIFDKILKAGAKPSNQDTMNELFGKSSLMPLE
jgi:hypothetical protein